MKNLGLNPMIFETASSTSDAQTVMTGSFDAMLFIEPRGQIERAGLAAARLLGHLIHGLVGKRVNELMVPREVSTPDIVSARHEMAIPAGDLTYVLSSLRASAACKPGSLNCTAAR